MVRVPGAQGPALATETVPLKLLGPGLALMAAVEVVLWLASRSLEPAAALALLGAARIVEAALLVFLAHKSVPGLSALGLNRLALPRGLRTGLVWSAVFGLVAAAGIISLYLTGMHPLSLFHMPLAG